MAWAEVEVRQRRREEVTAGWPRQDWMKLKWQIILFWTSPSIFLISKFNYEVRLIKFCYIWIYKYLPLARSLNYVSWLKKKKHKSKTSIVILRLWTRIGFHVLTTYFKEEKFHYIRKPVPLDNGHVIGVFFILIQIIVFDSYDTIKAD